MPRVLVVDDEADIRAVVALALESEGFEVDHAADGPAALHILSNDPPEVVVLDVMMPGTDGFEVLGQVRRMQLASGTKFIVATCRTSERDHIRGWELGADDYVTKPFDADDLAARVRAVVAASPQELAARRDDELAKASLLDRLEAAMRRPGRGAG